MIVGFSSFGLADELSEDLPFNSALLVGYRAKANSNHDFRLWTEVPIAYRLF